jgi:hypothetical protein
MSCSQLCVLAFIIHTQLYTSNPSQLLVNLRNAEATFGLDSEPYRAVRATVKEHLKSMKAKGTPTNLTGVRQSQSSEQVESKQSETASTSGPGAFANLAYRPKKNPSS